MKRIFDIAVAIPSVVLTSPVLIASSIIIWLEDGFSPLYFSKRVGLHGRVFTLIKLRSLTPNAEISGALSVTRNDTRMTSIGRFIRQYKIDEIPQFFNVILGKMSVVGPRPDVEKNIHIDEGYDDIKIKVKPGMTGLSSLVLLKQSTILDGYSDPDEAYRQLILPIKKICASYYVANGTIMMDFVLVALTAVALVSHSTSVSLLKGYLIRVGAPSELIQVVSDRLSAAQ